LLHLSGRSSSAFPGNNPILYYITDRTQLQNESLVSAIKNAISAGIDFVQIREKDLPDSRVYAITCKAVSLAQGTHTSILVNGRADIALAAGARGVHLTSQGLRASDLRPWLPPGFLIGVSTHSLREASEAWRGGADYLLVGPVFPTPSKLPYGPPLGLTKFRKICSLLPLPILGLGGIQRSMIGRVLDAGAAGVAGIRLFQGGKRMGKLELLSARGAENFPA
jgi:thiamine-phosphate pyrophosphorylase